MKHSITISQLDYQELIFKAMIYEHALYDEVSSEVIEELYKIEFEGELYRAYYDMNNTYNKGIKLSSIDYREHYKEISEQYPNLWKLMMLDIFG